MFHKEKMTIFVNGVEQEIELMPTYQKMFEFVKAKMKQLGDEPR